jgi:hypothetical protein
VERRRRDLEAEAGQSQHDADEQRQLVGVTVLQRLVDTDEIHRPRQAEDPAHAVDHRARSDATVDQILQRRFAGTAIVAQIAGEHIGRDADELERQIRHQQIRRRGHEECAEGAGQQQAVVLAALHATHFVGPQRHPDSRQRRQREDRLEEDRERVVDDHAAEQPTGWIRSGDGERKQRQHRARQSDFADMILVLENNRLNRIRIVPVNEPGECSRGCRGYPDP